jgi:hypothetical protein
MVVPNLLEVVSDPLQGAGINVGKECFKVRYSDVAANLFGSQRTTFTLPRTASSIQKSSAACNLS